MKLQTAGLDCVGQIRWAHANSRAALEDALFDRNVHGWIADVHRSQEVFTDVMAATDGQAYDLSFNQWLDRLLAGTARHQTEY